MRTLFLMIGVSALSGCVAYAPDAFEAPYQSGTPYGVEQHGYGPAYGATVVPYGAYGAYGGYGAYGHPLYAAPYGYGYGYGNNYRRYPRFYSHPAPRFYPHAYPHIDPRPRGPGWGMRDRDGDGVPNRLDRDRDGDGTPNRYDRRPGNPRRR